MNDKFKIMVAKARERVEAMDECDRKSASATPLDAGALEVVRTAMAAIEASVVEGTFDAACEAWVMLDQLSDRLIRGNMVRQRVTPEQAKTLLGGLYEATEK